MNPTDAPIEYPEPEGNKLPPEPEPEPGSATPWHWRAGIALGVVLLTLLAFQIQDWTEFLTGWTTAERLSLGGRVQAALGILCFFGVAAFLSADLKRVNWRTVAWGVVLQVALVLFVRTEPGYAFFSTVGSGIRQFVEFSEAGARFVFGPIADRPAMNGLFRTHPVYGPDRAFVFAFMALPTIIFVSSFFSVLYFLGILQFIVQMMARGMMRLMRTSGAETLSVTANVFIGQTEAPLIVKPYLPRMTQSELLTVMVGGMAHISGGMMAVYIGMGADEVAILATSVMAAPCSLYLSKVVLPEMETPETSGKMEVSAERQHRNAIDAASAGASDGVKLAINVAAMLIAFLAFLAMFDALLGQVVSGQTIYTTMWEGGFAGTVQTLAALAAVYFLLLLAGKHWWPGIFRRDNVPVWLLKGLVLLVGFWIFMTVVDALVRTAPPELRLSVIFSRLFAPAALLMGVQGSDVPIVANLLGTKLAANEFVAFLQMTQTYQAELSPRGKRLATYALTGFANFASIGIQLGGIGAMAENRRSDLARLGVRALLVGFLVTLINASIAGLVDE